MRFFVPIGDSKAVHGDVDSAQKIVPESGSNLTVSLVLFHLGVIFKPDEVIGAVGFELFLREANEFGVFGELFS